MRHPKLSEEVDRDVGIVKRIAFRCIQAVHSETADSAEQDVYSCLERSPGMSTRPPQYFQFIRSNVLVVLTHIQPQR